MMNGVRDCDNTA